MEKLRKIYIYDMLKYSIKKYVTIIICLILSCCLVFMYCNKKTDLVTVPKENSELTQTDVNAVNNMVTVRSLYNTATYYYYNGVLNRISALAVPKNIVQYKVSGIDNAADVCNILAASLKEDGVRTSILDKYKGVTNGSEYDTLISAEVNDNFFTIKIVGQNKDMCLEMTSIIEAAVLEKFDGIKSEYSSAALTKTNEYYDSSMDDDILEAQKLKKSVFERAYNDYKTALSILSTKQKQEYNRRISGTTADSTDSDTSVEKSSFKQYVKNYMTPKWLLISLLAGILSGIVVNCIIYCFRKTIRNIYEIEDFHKYGFVLDCNHKNNKDKGYDINLIQKKLGDSNETAVYLDIDCELSEKNNEFIESLKAQLKKKGYEPSVIGSAIDDNGDLNVKHGTVILVRKVMKSRYDLLCKETQIYKDNDVNVVGVIAF